MQLKDSSYTLSKATATNEIEPIRAWFVNQIAKQLGIKAQTIKIQEPLTRYGLDSIDSVTIVGEMEDWLGVELPSTLLWDYPTIEKAANYLINEMGITPVESTAAADPTVASTDSTEANLGKAWGGLWNRISGS
jgi:acyl carrier protein